MPGPGCNTDANNVLPQEKSGPYGVQVAFSIPVMTGNRRMVKLVRNRKGKSANLLSIACQPRNTPVSRGDPEYSTIRRFDRRSLIRLPIS